ncbi:MULTISPECIES: hypothetical protein [Nocardia]|uniref:ESX-1 secretion-associated protein EspA/EspE-like domain-containing protein n=2 Tax=Nocardia farcinica TaxID=37329 RepID=Q5YQ17_NOCFA|nr:MULTISPECIES: hypothetical protein [Nocardia]AXK87818.1 hypothetical protein DXT66_21295 [Nocardia farcinica]MBA4856542.1 hypothetical protein [Nocardia farcinica]MBC9816545.1 hypothetical protein [Nocardia farcinica]MBF6069330.1 hypothetical protein [Nocardia farcinica]MBF6142929.1 hypothetical protein [Nocardia farcinica]
MGDPVSKTDLDKIVEDFNAKSDEWRKKPDELNDAFDKLKWAWPQMYWLKTDERDRIQENLKKLFDKIEEAAEGIAAPFLFIEYAAKWQTVGNAVGAVNGQQNRPEISLEGHWDGAAYKRFSASRTAQSTAMTTTSDIAQKIHTELLNLAAEGRAFYKGFVDRWTVLIAEAAVAIAEIASVVEAFWGVDRLAGVITAAVDHATQTITSFLELQSKVVIASNELRNIIMHPPAFPLGADGQDHWPSSVSTDFESPADWKLDEG